MARFITLYSGSSGNAGLVESQGRCLLVDMGGSCKATMEALGLLGVDPQSLRGILVTHEHVDHVRGLAVFLKRVPVPVLATNATLQELWRAAAVPQTAQLVPVEAARHQLDGFGVEAFPTSHDAAGCCGFRIQAPDGGVMAIATDLGKMTASIFAMMEGAGLVALEANYDREMLRNGPYPPALKKRISGVTGHLSNDEAAATVAQLVATGTRRVALCHLSEENNHPDLVRKAVDAALFESGQRLPEDCHVQIARRYQPGDWMEF